MVSISSLCHASFHQLRRRLVPLVVLAVVASGLGVVLTSAPARAEPGWPCNGSVSEGPGWRTVTNVAIRINGVTYGRFNIGILNYGDQDLGDLYGLMVAVRDTRRDGLPPYVFVRMRTTQPVRTITSFEWHSYQSASGGWECHSMGGLGHIDVARVFGSVDNAPSIPEVGLLTWQL
jgi:hypothetical protein